MYERIEKALNVGANAVIGVDLDLMTLTNNMIVVSANGTAVLIEEEKNA
ncbi:MAG: YbjQ family protein [Roseburia sp.]|nr:YbjQ family protein [Roseburia sp.]